MARNRSEKFGDEYDAMVECYQALKAYCETIEMLGLDIADPDMVDELRPADKAYRDAYGNMARYCHIRGNRHSYRTMLETLGRNIEERFGSKPK